jgi:methylated-DNA-protein-cysteine methyltransferase-like protein
VATHGVYQRIYAVIRRIPAGRVATYGQVADLVLLPGHARQVGYALSALPDQNDVPWHRVVNAKGQVSTRSEVGHGAVQRALLEAEGVHFDEEDRIDLTRHRWRPRRGSLSR